MAKGHKEQHFVPAGYLRAWCDPTCPAGQEPFVWVFERDSRLGHRKAPRNIFSERDFYTETDAGGDRDLSLEHFFNRLETRFCDLRRRCLEPRHPIGSSEHVLLCLFCAAMNARTRAMREHIRSQWEPILEYGVQLEEWTKTASESELESRRRLPTAGAHNSHSMTLDDIRHIVERPAQTAVRNNIGIEAPSYAAMDMAILCTDDPVGFITSDAPCTWFDPQFRRLPPAWRSLDCESPTIEVTLPLSPTRLLFFNHRGVRGYKQASEGSVREANRLTRSLADRAYVVRHNTTLDHWFKGGPLDQS